MRPGAIVGVDLSGPTNVADTAAACFVPRGREIVCRGIEGGLDDAALLDLATDLAKGRSRPLVVGLDAPLAYQPGGGDRPSDRELRRRLVAAGMPPGSVMTPTMTRMAYLTLRGIAVARALERALPGVAIVEAHPGAAMVLRGAPVAAVRGFKTKPTARRRLASWLAEQGLRDLPARWSSDHALAAAACALAAWRWSAGEPVWCARAAGPLAPYDFAV